MLPEQEWRARQLLVGVSRGKQLDSRDADLVREYLKPEIARGVARGLLSAEIAERAVALWRRRRTRGAFRRWQASRGQKARKAPLPTRRNWRPIKTANGRYRVT